MKEKYVFYATLGIVGGSREETVVIEFDGDETEEEKEEIVREQYDIWLSNFSDFGWYKTEQ